MTNAERQKRHREKCKALRVTGEEALRIVSKSVTKRGGTVTEEPKSVTVGVTDVVESVTPVTVEWDKEKYPERKAWEIAVLRVERAQKYAGMFPQFIGPEDMKFQDLGWQYENEGLAAIRKRETYLVS